MKMTDLYATSKKSLAFTCTAAGTGFLNTEVDFTFKHLLD